MKQQEAQRRAVRARRLRDNADLWEVIEELRAEQIDRFVNSPADQPDVREAAHGVLRALTAIEQKLATDEAGGAMVAKKKGQHRASD